jgi:hypothetical protein
MSVTCVWVLLITVSVAVFLTLRTTITRTITQVLLTARTLYQPENRPANIYNVR